MIDSVGGSSDLSVQAGGASAWKSRFEKAMDPVAKLFGMSDDELESDLRSGQSLAQIASAKGVSSDDLTTAVTQGLQSAGISAPPGTDSQTFVQNLINQPGGHHRHHHHKQADDSSTSGVSSGVQQALGSLASAFGMNESDMLQSLQSGTTLSQLADQQGVSQESVAQLLGQSTLGQSLIVDTTA